ncbi:response regulator [Azohydromonas lata]|uniref:response regulator n=1 Tax=Azohydromonas lata TaxID=45677 RepID=UPI0009FE51F8|nr:response regulator transcription factor [Azohydromonas lata]
MIRCLLVDDDLDIRLAVQAYLERYGLRLRTAEDGAAMRRALGEERFDLLLLDVMLPGEDGLELCREVVQSTALPVIMLTAQGDPVSRVLGLELGADDYISKPFEPRELIARIHAVLRRSRRAQGAGAGAGVPAAADAAGPLRFEGWCFDRLRRELVSAGGVTVSLSAAEFRLLSAFVAHAGRVLARERLVELAGAPGVEVNERSIDLGVSRLRQKLGDSPREPALIRTVRGEGYLFDAQVSA